MNGLCSAHPTRGVRRLNVAAAVLAATFAAGAGVARAEGMSVSSPAFADGGMLPAIHAGLGDCGGQNVSPPIEWKNLPQATRSVVVTMKDPDGAKGGGVVHWVAYNIPATVSSLAAGHLTLVPAVKQALESGGRPDIMVVVGGIIPAADHEALRDAGAAAIFPPGTVISDAAAELIRDLNQRLGYEPADRRNV